MTKFFFFSFLLMLLPSLPMKKIYTFSKDTSIKNWRIVNDGVMGGLSKSTLSITNNGNGDFSGKISLENNGGFASVQLDTAIIISEEVQFIVLHLKGDEKKYEFRLKSKYSQYESYVHPFKTNGEWEIIKLEISKFYPQYRGRKLNIPNFNFNDINQISFLIGNKKEEDFKLLIDYIGFE